MSGSPSLPFSFQPPPGGDISLKSADGIVFFAHSVLLGLASTVFQDMFSTATQKDVIELTDDAESLSLMLRFIYQPPFTDVLPITLLEKSLRIAQKYDVERITKSLDYFISHSFDKNSPIHSDPIYALCLATAYDLPKTRIVATESTRNGRFELCDPKHIERLAKAFSAPGASRVIGLLGARCIQTRSLCNLLLKRTEDILPWTGDDDELMMCDVCVAEAEFPYEESVRYRPSWLDAWCLGAYCDLTTQPFERASRVFQVPSPDTLYGELGICRNCIDATIRAGGGEVFELWARDIENKVKAIFDSVEALYSL
ncbi:hypothetical protein FRC08_014698 [Ceratobasidium sp. 394]|nr:hypothetical protein FRC08_014698 [Ceratobasidium sp. 394]